MARSRPPQYLQAVWLIIGGACCCRFTLVGSKLHQKVLEADPAALQTLQCDLLLLRWW